MSFINLQFMGRFGNQLFQYAFARAYAERHGLELRTDPWIGQKIFQLNEPACVPCSVTLDEFSITDESRNFTYRSYSQQQKCLIYTREQVKSWLKFRPEIVDAMKSLEPDEIVAHRRVGDYAGYGYVLVSQNSYIKAAADFGLNPNCITWITEERPTAVPQLSGELAMIPDFYRIIQAKNVFRGNSSFSWWAATLGSGKVFSPVIDGLLGGVENDVEFVEGNWPRFANLDFVTDLHLQ